MKKGSLEGRSVVIVGASRGLGAAAARAYAERGARVGLLARDLNRLEEIAREIGPHALTISTDITDAESVDSAFSIIGERFGTLDVLINCAGINHIGEIEGLTNEEILSIVGTNFLGPIYTIRSAVPLLRHAGGGQIINVSSQVTTLAPASPFLAYYMSSKAGMEAFGKAANVEFRRWRIRVTTLVLGALGGTEFAHNWSQDDIERMHAAFKDSGHLAVYGSVTPLDLRDVTRSMLYLSDLVMSGKGVVDVMHLFAAPAPESADPEEQTTESVNMRSAVRRANQQGD